MPNLVITSNATHVSVAFNDYAGNTAGRYGYEDGYWRKDHIASCKLAEGDSFVEVVSDHAEKWLISYDGSEGMQVDTVDGAAPVSNADLYAKVKAIL